ncbi:pilus assembly protein [bacterium]|nr:MAG: pilus assembly protein [bacterium]
MTALDATRRGVAIPETALMIGFTMLVLFAAVHLTLVAYLQAQTDGAAYVAAHTVGQNPQSSLSADQSYAARVVQSVFPHVQASGLGVVTTGSTVSSSVAQTADGLPIPGAPSTIALNSHVVEPIAQTTPGTVAPFTFGANASLKNYCATPAYPYQSPTLCPAQQTYQIYVAQTMSAKGNGINGRFSEWICHSGYYSSVGFPSQRPQGGAGSAWDPNNPQSGEYALYQWDAGSHSCT